MSDEVSIKGLFQSLCPEQLDIISAKIISVNPLKAVSTNNTKMQISSQSLIVPECFSRHYEKMSFYIEDKYYSNVNVLVDNALNVGDVVYLLYLKNISKFFILGRRDS